VDGTRKTYAAMLTAAKTPASDVAEVIFTAATDGTDKSRCFIGVDNPPLIKARREMSEEDYIRFVRATYYGGKLPSASRLTSLEADVNQNRVFGPKTHFGVDVWLTFA